MSTKGALERYEVDEGIASHITKINDKGFRTRWSCSGLRSDHPRGVTWGYLPGVVTPMIGFVGSTFDKPVPEEQRQKIRDAAEKVGWIYAEWQEKTQVFVDGDPDKPDAEIEKDWSKFVENLLI